MTLWLHLLQGDELCLAITLNIIQHAPLGLYVCSLAGLMAILLFCYLSVPELEKLHFFAVNGSEVEKLAASKILCGASFLRGWNIQV